MTRSHPHRPHRGVWLGGITGLFIALFFFFLWQTGSLDTIEHFSLDTQFMVRFRLGPWRPPNQSVSPGSAFAPQPLPVTVVQVDDRALAAFGSWPWSKRLQGQIIEEILRFRPAVLGIGVVYADIDPGDDPAFALRLRSDIPVVLAASVRDERVLYPRFELLAPNVSVGHTRLSPEADGVTRKMQFHVETPFGTLAPFGWEVVRKALQSDGADVNPTSAPMIPPLDGDGQFVINYVRQSSGGFTHRSLVDTISAVELFDPDAMEKVTNRIVLYGVATPRAGTGSGRLTSLRSVGMVPDIAVHGAVAHSVVNDKHIHRPKVSASFVIIAALSTAMGVVAFSVNPIPAGLWGAVVSVAVFGFAVAVFTASDLWLPLAPMVGAVVTTSFVGIAYTHLSIERHARRIRSTFERYVSPEVADVLLQSPDLADMRGGRRPVTVLFADIRGFTSYSENKDPETVFALLNDYFDVMTAAVQDHGGMVDKYVGDGMMAIFGAPLPSGNHEEKAVMAALDMLERFASRHFALPIGIGIHTGEVLVGSVGPWKRQEYTAVGDVVNVAARLQEAAGAGRLLLSAQTYAALSPSVSFRFRPLRPLKVRGRSKPVEVYEAS